MQTLPNDIVLRPRFQLELPDSKEIILETFEAAEKKSFLVNRIDDHIFIKFRKELLHFWSPQLHLEINEFEKEGSKLYGLFGPNPSLWTFFMFLHFGVATIFTILSIVAYSRATLGRTYGLYIGLMVLMLLVWFSLYIFGRLGKRKGKPQMRELYGFMMEVLGN